MLSVCFGVPFNVLKYVALIISGCDLEGESCVMALQYSSVIVEDCQLASRVAQKAVRAARVVHVVYGGSNQGSHFINGI